ncbi:MAG: spermidine/putrescine transporter ATP-binding protein [Phycisphaerales bacterium]|nr:spermidine/putrescine transporter ATP-binding protein [Phycisphaerales bacterium]
MTSVRIESVSKKFGETVALDAVDLTIEAGELFFLLGPSGCGKSTLLRIIAGLLEPTAGRIFFNDRDVTGQGTEKRNAVMCFQSYALWPHMTVEENIRFGLEVRKIPKLEQATRVAEAIRQVQLEALARRKPNQLSGGQQQRVALARALVVHPDCLLLDEPLSNLDAKLRLDMRAEIRRICRAAGLTAIYVTHDQKEALSIADRMAVLNKGRIEQIGRPQDLYLRPGNLFVASFMGETNLLTGKVVGGADGMVEVETSMGRLRSSTAPAGQGGLAAGSEVTVSVRPETIRLGDGGSVNRFEGMVHDTLYLGEVAQHRVSIGADGRATELKVFELNPKFVARDEARERASISIDPADVVVLQR